MQINSTVSVEESSDATESASISPTVETNIRTYAPVVANLTTLSRSPSFTIDDYATADETMLLESQGYGTGYGTNYGGGEIARHVSMSETGIADAYMTMRTPTGEPNVSEIGAAVESGSASVPALSDITEQAIADESGSVSTTTIQEIQETIFREIVNEAMSMDVDSDTNIYHAIELYHTVTGNSPSEVEYPRHEVRYEE